MTRDADLSLNLRGIGSGVNGLWRKRFPARAKWRCSVKFR